MPNRNMGGRKPGQSYQLYGFTPEIVNGKYMALCICCKKYLQNTSGTRMQGHRNVCKGNKLNTINKEQTTISEPQSHTSHDESLSEIEIVQIKREELHIPAGENITQESSYDNVYDEQIEHIQDYLNDANCTQAEQSTSVECEVSMPSTKFPNSKKLVDLQEQKIRSEIDYFKKKTSYFTNEMVNLKTERTLMLLQAKKLRLEIEKMENDF